MFRLKKISLILIMIIFTWLALPGPSAIATVDVTTSFVSERKTTLISLHHEDASPMPLLIAELAQNVDALDNLFHRQQNDGQLLPSHPVLAIKISDDAYQRVLSGPRADGYAVLSLEKDYRRDLDPHDILSADAVAFGPVYRIELALWPVSINELFALVLLLPELSADNPRKELMAADIRQYRDRFDGEIARIAGEWSYSDLLWSPDGSILLSAAWHNRRLQYQAFNFTANERISLEPLEHYILPPTFTPDSRYIVYSSQTELRIVDVNKHRTTGFSLRELIPGDYQFINRVEFAVNKTGDALVFSMRGWGMPAPVTFLWRSADPDQLETISGLGFLEKPNLPGDTWSYFLHRWHAATVRSFTGPAELKKEKMADSINLELAANLEKLQARYGAIYSETINYPRNDYLAVLIEDGNRLKARVFSLPSLEARLIYAFAFMSGHRPEIPGRIAGISLFNVAVVVLMLLMAAAMTKLIIFVKQKYGRQPAAPMSKRKKLLLFAGALLITLLLHFAAAILHNNIANGIPEAVHDGFKVVSTPFFTAEIPLAWQLEALDGAPMFWRINKNGDHVGEIMFIPYFTEHEEPPTGDGFLYASLSDEALLRRVLINVSADHADQTIPDKITGSFKMVAGPKTSVDMQTAAQRYVRTGGREIFGKIEEVVIAAGNPVGILIKEKEFILDDEAPSGFRIETLPDAPAEYPVAPGANVLPLVPPHYTSHGAYYMPPLKDFIANYNYKDNFYIFIAGADGEIKMILQRYVP